MAELIARGGGPVEPGGLATGAPPRDSRAATEQVELAALRTMAAAIRDGLSVDGTVSHCLERTLDHLGLDFGCIYVKRHDYLIRLATHEAEGGQSNSPLGLGASPVADVDMALMHAHGGSDAAGTQLIPMSEAPWATRPFVASQNSDNGGKSWMALPLAIGPSLVGVLVLGGSGRSARDLPALPTARRLAEPLAVAIENAERISSVRGLLNDTRDIIFRTDGNGRWTYLNAAWQEAFGVPVAMALGQRATFYVHPEHRSKLGDGLEALVPRGSVAGRQTVPFSVRHGKTRWLDVQARLVFDDRGQVVGAAGVLRDVSVAVRQSQELRHVNDELRQRAEELEGAIRELAEADRLKSEFLCSVSHELRTPLAVMLGYTEMLQDGLPEPVTNGQHELLAFIAEGGRQLQRRILDVLLVTNLEGRRVTLHPQPTRVWPLIEQVANDLAPIAASKGVSLELTPPVYDPLVMIDGDRLAQVVEQLVENAIKFGRRGGWARVGLSQHDGQVVLEIADNGEGIPPERQTTLFRKFVQADGSDTRKHGGLGLGLVIARGLLELMDGEVELRSDGADRGSTARVTLQAA